MAQLLGEPTGQGWVQVFELAFALVLSALIGLERELRRKSAGLRTHTLIGFSSALVMLVSKYGFTDVLGDHVVLDPSRVAAQIISGIGFIGGGLIFVKRDAVRGLTTAAAVWLTTAVGMAAGAGLPVLALATTAGYFVVLYGFTPLSVRLQRRLSHSQLLEIVYEDGRGLLRTILNTCTARGWLVGGLSTHHVRERVVSRGEPAGNLNRRDTVSTEEPGDPGDPGEQRLRPAVTVLIALDGKGRYEDLAAELTELDGVLEVNVARPEDEIDTETE